MDGILACICGFLQLLVVPLNRRFLAAFLWAVAVLFGDALFAFDKKCRWRLGAGLAAGVWLPEFVLFLPVTAYSAAGNRQWLFPLLALGLGLVHLAGGTLLPESFYLALFGAVMSIRLALRAEQTELLEKRLRVSTDDSREAEILLEEKNKALREKQDYEVYTATLRERNRIAREIHDNVGHLLSRAILLAGAMKAINRDDQLREPLGNLESSLNTAMTSIRTSVHDLHDEAVDLHAGARDLAEGFSFCPVELIYDMGRSVPSPVKYCFLTILKEALNNVMKHSSATRVQVTMREQPGLYQLSIGDNGTGSAVREGGIGLSNMEQRVRELGGLFRIQTQNGFRIFITIPRRWEE